MTIGCQELHPFPYLNDSSDRDETDAQGSQDMRIIRTFIVAAVGMSVSPIVAADRLFESVDCYFVGTFTEAAGAYRDRGKLVEKLRNYVLANESGERRKLDC